MSFELGAGLWLLLALAVGILAAQEFGRSGFRWFLLALVFTPLAGLLLFLLPARRRPCPFCAEPIQPSAVLCRFCGREVPVAEGAGLPARTRWTLFLLIIVVLVLASLSQCHTRFQWWRGGETIEVEGPRPGLA
ncbi:MAG: hypothetical protein ACKOCD_09855 [Nitrospiraceae bacterium]